MKLPFNLDLKTIVITVVFMMFVLPWIMGFVGRMGNGNGNGNKQSA